MDRSWSYPFACTDREGKMFCCIHKHILISHGGSEALANKMCPERVQYIQSTEPKQRTTNTNRQ